MSDYRFTVRGIDDTVLNLMKVAATRMRLTQAEAVEAALRLWLQDAMDQCPDRFAPVERAILGLRER